MARYYVRATNGSDSAGGGTSHATAYKTIQYALDDIGTTHGRGATGDQVNICDAASEGPNVLAGPLSLATYGTPTFGRLLTLRGYTSVANDGGEAEINCGGNGSILIDGYDYVLLVDLFAHSPGDDEVWNAGTETAAVQCRFDKGASTPTGNKYLVLGSDTTLINCMIQNTPQRGVSVAKLLGCFLDACDGISAVYNVAQGCIFRFGNAYSYTQGSNNRGHTIGNIFCSTIASNMYGANIAGRGHVVANNVFAGFSGAGARGVNYVADVYMAGNNAFYNCTTAYNPNAYRTVVDFTAHDIQLTADPFVDAANGDFRLTDDAKAALAGKGWPAGWPGLPASVKSNLTIGPLQMELGGGGGGAGPVIGSRIIRGWGMP